MEYLDTLECFEGFISFISVNIGAYPVGFMAFLCIWVMTWSGCGQGEAGHLSIKYHMM